jgi:radical SAM protein with 4Fe4S-binding SPASM domain
MRITTQVERFNYLLRHMRSLIRYITFKKLLNAAVNYLEASFKVESPRSLPPYIKIESTPACQLSCTGCAHRDPDFKRQFNATSHLTLENFKRMIDPIVDTTLGVSISFRGEPLLNRQLPAIVAYAHARGIATSFPTNLSMPISERFAEEIVSSGLDALYISLDGASSETYLQYRVGGDFDAVLANTRLLADTKRRLGNKRLRLIWKMVVFDHNRHELQIQQATYRSLGFDEIESVPDHYSDETKNRRAASNKSMIERKSGCWWLWHTIVVTSDGNISPCCNHDQFGLGNALDGIQVAWRSAPYQALRRAFSSERFGQDMHPTCRKCIGLTVPIPLLVPISGAIEAKIRPV